MSHNYQSELVIGRGRLPWGKATLTKALFKDNPVALRLGPSHEWALSRTAFVRHQRGEFVFATRLGIPDSDVFVEAEVGMVPPKGLRVIKVSQQVPDSSLEE